MHNKSSSRMSCDMAFFLLFSSSFYLFSFSPPLAMITSLVPIFLSLSSLRFTFLALPQSFHQIHQVRHWRDVIPWSLLSTSALRHSQRHRLGISPHLHLHSILVTQSIYILLVLLGTRHRMLTPRNCQQLCFR